MSREKGKERKPLYLAKRWFSQAPRMAGRTALTLLAVVIMGMLFSALQGISALWLRMLLSASIVAVLLLMFFNDGLGKGSQDASASRFCAQLIKSDREPEASSDAECYHPLKALSACALLFAVPLALSIALCVRAKPYTYALQDLPTWLTGAYGARADVMGPLGAYMQPAQGVDALGWVRVFVRLLVMCFINLFPDPLRMTGLIDRLTPLMVAAYPLAYMAGYLCGPRVQRKREKQNRRAKKTAARKANKSNLAAQLVGEQNAVHYGQRPQSEKPKKKELI